MNRWKVLLVALAALITLGSGSVRATLQAQPGSGTTLSDFEIIAEQASRVRLLVDGPAAEHDLVLRARLAGQAPDIDPLVYLTECDPSELSPGEFIQAEIVGSRGYDLLARPL